MAKGAYRVLTNRDEQSLEIHTYDYRVKRKHHSEHVVVGVILPNESPMRLRQDEIGIWKISEGEFQSLLKHADIKYDPSIELPLSREEFIIASAIDGLEFDRWGASIDEIRKGNEERYSHTTKEDLTRAIAALSDRFGEDHLQEALKYLVYQHASRLHIPEQVSKAVLAQNNAFGDVHSDILGFKRDISKMVIGFLGNAHSFPSDIERDGYGAVNQGVYNAKTVFGDQDLLEILNENYPSIFQEIIRYLINLKPIDQGYWYGDTIVHPLQALKQYFPESCKYVATNFKGEIPNEEGPAVVYKDTE